MPVEARIAIGLIVGPSNCGYQSCIIGGTRLQGWSSSAQHSHLLTPSVRSQEVAYVARFWGRLCHSSEDIGNPKPGEKPQLPC
jgi:hypothetical protein